MNTRRNPRLFAAAAAGIALIAGAGYLAFAPVAPGAPGDTRDRTPDAPPRDGIGALTEHRAGTPEGLVGRRADYEVSLDSAYALETKGERTPTQSLGLSGGMRVQVLAQQDDATIVAVRFGTLQWSVSGKKVELREGDPACAVYATAVHARTLMKLDREGRVLGYGFAKGVGSRSRNFLRGTLAPFAFTFRNGARAWESTEADATGVFRAAYRASSAGGEHTVRREKLRYVELSHDEQGLPEHEVGGSATAAFDPALGLLTRAEVDETTRLAVPAMKMTVHMQQRGTLRLSEQAIAALEPEDRDLTGVVWSPAGGHREQHEPQTDGGRSREDDRLRGLSVDEQLQKIAAVLKAKPNDPDATNELWLDLAGILRVRPELAAEMRTRIERGELDGVLASKVLTALGAAGHEEAQTTLAALRTNTALPVELRETTCVAMLQLAAPRPALMQDLARDVAASTKLEGMDACNLLLLGTLAGRSKDQIADGKPALELLRNFEDKAQRSDGLHTWLAALGNTGSKAVAGDLLRYADHGDASVRAEAFRSMRQIATPAVVERLVTHGLVDTEPQVRVAAAAALAGRPDARAYAALRRVAAEDEHVAVRRAAVEAIAQRGKLTGEDREALQRVASRDADEPLRRFAKQMLGRQG
ncbi:MAG: HEAT repeat domain-containing protein [Planctomycetes bacterium]|nr:HEAT repeat domain-containing protein [Planctomycetota bacterium]